MNPKEAYLAWVRTNYPALYFKALQATFGTRSGLGGLGDDLLSSVGIDAATADLSSDTTGAIDAAYSASQSPDSTTQGGSTDFWTGLVNTIKGLAPTVVQTQQSEVIIKQNAQRAARGLPLLDQSGHVIPNSGMATASAALQRMEAALSGSSWLPMALLAGAALLVLKLVRK